MFRTDMVDLSTTVRKPPCRSAQPQLLTYRWEVQPTSGCPAITLTTTQSSARSLRLLRNTLGAGCFYRTKFWAGGVAASPVNLEVKSADPVADIDGGTVRTMTANSPLTMTALSSTDPDNETAGLTGLQCQWKTWRVGQSEVSNRNMYGGDCV
jgi:hypothetical protein